MHSDITKEDHEQSNYFPVIVVLYGPYTREEDYKRLNRTLTPVIYLTYTISNTHPLDNEYALYDPMHKHNSKLTALSI